MRIETPVTQVEVDEICDVCQKGRMRPTGQCFSCYPPVYEHICTDCCARCNFEQTYPHLAYRKQP